MICLLRGYFSGHPCRERDTPSDLLIGGVIWKVPKGFRILVPSSFGERKGFWNDGDGLPSPLLVFLPKSSTGPCGTRRMALTGGERVAGSSPRLLRRRLGPHRVIAIDDFLQRLPLQESDRYLRPLRNPCWLSGDPEVEANGLVQRVR